MPPNELGPDLQALMVDARLRGFPREGVEAWTIYLANPQLSEGTPMNVRVAEFKGDVDRWVKDDEAYRQRSLADYREYVKQYSNHKEKA